jgi:ketosteroid isomerase-like protein
VSANLDLVRSIFADWERGDFPGSVQRFDPEFEYVWRGGPSSGRWTGLARAAEGFRDFLSAWEDYRIEAEGYRELDEERVLVLVRSSGRGKTSRIEIAQIPPKAAALFEVRNGEVARLVIYWDRDRAFADLGLEG